MKPVIDDLPVILISRLRATGEIGPDTKATTIRFDNGEGGVEFVVGIVQRRSERTSPSLSMSTSPASACAVYSVSGSPPTARKSSSIGRWKAHGKSLRLSKQVASRSV
jgi:hypothetical protein